MKVGRCDALNVPRLGHRPRAEADLLVEECAQLLRTAFAGQP